MWYSYRFLLLIGLLLFSTVHAFNFYVDALWWQASETIDWCLTNDLHEPNQTIAYRTIKFNFEPGFRVGVGHKGDWDTRLTYTRYSTQAEDIVTPTVKTRK